MLDDIPPNDRLPKPTILQTLERYISDRLAMNRSVAIGLRRIGSGVDHLVASATVGYGYFIAIAAGFG